MPVVSKKRRLRYAFLEDGDESSQDDNDEPATVPSQQEAGEQPFEEARKDSFQQYEDEEHFILPYQDASSSSSSSSESESEDNEEEPEQQKPHHYANEDDLFDAAFVAPTENRSTWEKENSQENVYPPPLNQPRQPLMAQAEHEVVDLCADSDDDDEDDFTAGNRATFQGLRTQQKSPMFNANSRRGFSPHIAAAPRAKPSKLPNANDDIVECWSSEDEGNQKPRARRVTNTTVQEERSNVDWNVQRGASRNAGARRLSTWARNDDSDEHAPAFMPAPSRRRPSLNTFKEDRSDRLRRLRNANTGIHTAASVMRRNTNNTAPVEQASDDVYFRQGTQTPRTTTANSSGTEPLRNDLMGGSGVGAGSYTFNRSQSFQHTFQQPPAKGRKRTKRAPARKKPTAKGGAKKRGGGRKRFNYRGRGGKTKSSRGGRSRGRGANDNAEYSRKDPLLKNVGGASITF